MRQHRSPRIFYQAGLIILSKEITTSNASRMLLIKVFIFLTCLSVWLTVDTVQSKTAEKSITVRIWKNSYSSACRPLDCRASSRLAKTFSLLASSRAPLGAWWSRAASLCHAPYWGEKTPKTVFETFMTRFMAKAKQGGRWFLSQFGKRRGWKTPPFRLAFLVNQNIYASSPWQTGKGFLFC